uniref:Putative tick serine protease n=1 Tax=Rhipicephalus pulchellus TaxID=72859 RepID=L7MBE5_RHIPC
MTPMMVKFLIGLSLLLVTLDGLSAQRETINPEGCGKSFYKTMIVNGTLVEDYAQYPWMVFLEVNYPVGDPRGCGGSIITRRHILTAAHCVSIDNMFAERVVVLYGSVDIRRTKKVDASKMLIHKDYYIFRTEWAINDIALLEVKYPFTFGRDVSPICLQMAPMPIADKDAVAAGWGSDHHQGGVFPLLRHTTVTISDDERCTLRFWMNRYSAGLQCCSYKLGTGVCSGDSGGPLMIRIEVDRFHQVGINSYVGGPCGRDRDVYTRVSGYANWLTRGVSSSGGYMPLGKAITNTLESDPFLIK